MAPAKRPWFRMYCEVFTDPDVRAVPPALRWAWAALLGLARSSPVAGVLLDKAGEPISEAVIADYAAVKPSEAKAAIKRFTAYGWLERNADGALVLTKWDRRQFETDDVTKRTARHRRRNVPNNADGTFHAPTMERSSLTGTEVQRTELVDLEGEEPLYAAPPAPPTTATQLLRPDATTDLVDELQRILDALDARHGTDRLNTAITALAGKRYQWPSDARRALEQHLGQAPPEDRTPRCPHCDGRFMTGTGWLHERDCPVTNPLNGSLTSPDAPAHTAR
jgi:hypothetical protein